MIAEQLELDNEKRVKVWEKMKPLMDEVAGKDFVAVVVAAVYRPNHEDHKDDAVRVFMLGEDFHISRLEFAASCIVDYTIAQREKIDRKLWHEANKGRVV